MEETVTLEATDTKISKGWALILINDDTVSFDLVVESLMEICGHGFEQAQQCAMIVHNKGHYAVKYGTYDDIKIMADKFISRSIDVTIEQH